MTTPGIHPAEADHKESAIAAVREFLISKARNETLTTYEDTWAVARKYGHYIAADDPQLCNLLEIISSREMDFGRPPLSVLVIRKHGSRGNSPGENFFTLMREKGCYRNNDEATFSEHLKSTFAYWPVH